VTKVGAAAVGAAAAAAAAAKDERPSGKLPPSP